MKLGYGFMAVLGMFMLYALALEYLHEPEPKTTLTNNSTFIINEQDSLTEWQIFIMSLVEVECERNPNVKSIKNAVGPFQITQTYIDEVNRLYKTQFTIDDAWDLDKSLTMFEMMNDYYNPSRNIDKAIKLHNPGAGKWYSKRIKDRMKMIQFNEELRYKIIDLYNN